MSKVSIIEKLLYKAGYSKKAVELYLHEVNVGLIKNPDAISTCTGNICGDSITLFIKRKNKLITDAKFPYAACTGTATVGSALTSLTLNKTMEEAWKITPEDTLKALGGLQESYCADPAIDASRLALEKLEKS